MEGKNGELILNLPHEVANAGMSERVSVIGRGLTILETTHSDCRK